MKLAVNNTDIFGKISPPAGMDVGGADPVAGLGKFLGFGINLFLTVIGLTLLIFLLWGAFDWIASGGEKERLQKAQNKITNAVIGILLVFVVLAVFGLLAGDLLGIIVNTPQQGWQIKIPVFK